MQLLLDYYKEVRGDAEPLGVRYVSDVWLPEVRKFFCVTHVCMSDLLCFK